MPWDPATYDRVAGPQARWGADVVGRVGAATRVLDAGCGTGRVTEQLLERYPSLDVVALDGSAEMLGEARRRLGRWGARVSFVQADLTAPLPELGSFDVVFSTATFHWIRDHDALFRSLASVLRPDGRLVAQWGGRGNLDAVLRVMRDLGLDADRWTFAGEEETVERLRAAGYADVTVWSHPDPATFRTREDLERFLDSVVLFEAVAHLPPERRREAVRLVADRLPGLAIDYVRLNAMAHRP